MDKDTFINSILESTNLITKVVPNDELFNKIEFRIKENSVSKKSVFLVAASIVILCTINIMLLTETSRKIEKSTNTLENIINNNNQIYR